MLAAEGGVASAAAASPAAHPSYGTVASVCTTYPTQAAAVLQTYLDLTHAAAAWQDVEPCELRSSSTAPDTARAVNTLSSVNDEEAEQLVKHELAQWKGSSARLGLVETGSPLSLAALIGRRKDSKKGEVIVPLSVSHHMEPSQMEHIFQYIESLATQRRGRAPIETDHVLLSIIAQDSTLVYYRLSKGLVKPVN